MIETKVIQVQNDTNVINKSNEIWAYFGWQVLSVQVTFSQNTKTYTKIIDFMLDTGIDTVETTTVEFATITYQRDTGIRNYDKLFNLENRFNQTADKMNSLESEHRNTQNSNSGAILAKIGMGYFIILGLGIAFNNFNILATLGGVAMAIGAPILIKRIYDNTTGKRYEEKRLEMKQKYGQLKRELAVILNEAADL